MRSNYRKGFSLIELMIVVTIIGILAAIAIPSFNYFISNSKKTDGREKLYEMSQGAIVYFNEFHSYSTNGLNKKNKSYPGCNANNTAFSVCNHSATTAIPKSIKKAPTTDFNKVPWIKLHFSISSPVYYQFVYNAANDTAFSGCARASLDDEDDSLFTISGKSDGTLSPMIESNDATTCTARPTADVGADDDDGGDE